MGNTSEVIQEHLTEQAKTDLSAHFQQANITANTPAPIAPTPVAPAPAVVEVPVETPASESVAKPEIKEPEVKPAAAEAEVSKPEKLDLSIPSVTGSAATEATSQANQPATDQYKAVAEKYETLTKNPQAKFVLDWIESGKDITELPSVFKTVDYSQMDADTLTENLSAEFKWTEEQLQAQKEYMDTLSPYEKEQYKRRVANDLNEIQKSRLEQSTAGIRQEQERQAAVMQQAVIDIEQEATGMIGKEVFGVVMNEQDAADFKKFVSEFNIYDANGKVNAPLLRNMWVGVRKLPTIQSEAYKNASAEATIKTVEEFTRPSTNGSVASGLPQPQAKPAPQEQASKALEAFMKGL